MSDAAIAVNIAGYTGDSCFHIPVTTSSTAGGIIALVKECLPQCLWHGNTMLSCGLHQLRPDTIVDTRRLGAWVLINFSEISNQEMCSILDTAERGMTLKQLQKLLAFISKVADQCCETFGDHRGRQLQFETFNLYHTNHWIIKPATEGYGGKGCSLVEVMAVEVQRPHWFVSHAWIEPVYNFLACLEQHALVRKLSMSTAFWVCAYANNQHCVADDITSNPRSTSFYRAMQMSQGVLLVLDSGGTPFERIWCCFEESVAIEHREGNWSRSHLLLDVGATDAQNHAHVLTDGLAGAESCMIGIVGLYQKSVRERAFPLSLLKKGLEVKIEEAKATEQIDKDRILKSIAFPRAKELEDSQSTPTGHPNFQRVDEALASHFALASWYGFVWGRRPTESLARALRADVGRKVVQLSFTGCQHFSDGELEVLLQNLPRDLRVLRLDLGFSALETLDFAAKIGPDGLQFSKSLVELTLRFTGSSSFRSAGGLAVLLREMENLVNLEIWFMNLPRLNDLGSLNSALLCLENLEDLIFELSGCQVSLDVRRELDQSIRSLKWTRGSSLDMWVHIEGFPSGWCDWPFGSQMRSFRSLCSRCFTWFVKPQRSRSSSSASSSSGSSSSGNSSSRFGRLAYSSDEAEIEGSETEIEENELDLLLDEARPFPCSHFACASFHAQLHGYCERHRWFGLAKRMFVRLNTVRQLLELSLLILTQAAAEIESRHLLLLIIISLLPAACLSISQSTGVPGTVAFLLIVIIAVSSIAFTTARLQRMHDLSKQLEIQVESMYAKHLQTDMSRLFGGGEGCDKDIVQPHINSLKEHFIEARKRFAKFNKEICLPLQQFLKERGSLSVPALHALHPALKLLTCAQEDVIREGSPNHIADILYCDVTFYNWDQMMDAWHFLRTIASDELNHIQIMSLRDLFAVATTGRRCAEMVLRIDGYFATIRFLDRAVTELEDQIDHVHTLARQLGLVASHFQIDPQLVSGRRARRAWKVSRRPTWLRAAVSALRLISSLAAMYLAIQYFVRYSPPFLRSSLPKLVKDFVSLKEMVTSDQPGEQIRSGSADSVGGRGSNPGWLEKSRLMLPSILFSLPYLALTIVLLSDLHRRSRKQKLKVKPTQLLYEEYFGTQGRFYSLKVAILQFFTVMLQALGKLQIMGGIVSLSFHPAGEHDVVPFQRCFWAFVGFLCLNSIYPSILFLFPSQNWARLGAAMMDAILDVAYTSTYLIIAVLAIYELGLDQKIAGNFGDAPAVNFRAALDPTFAFPTDFLGFFAVFYSLAHVCSVCRAVERDRFEHSSDRFDRRSSHSTVQSARMTRCCKVLYSPCLLVAILWLLLSTDAYPTHSTDFGCFPCRCKQVAPGSKELISCGLAGVLKLKDVSLSKQEISSVGMYAFRSLGLIQRLSLQGNQISVLPKKIFAPLRGLQLLDLAHLGLERVESETFLGLSSLRILLLSRNHLQQLPEDLLRPMPALEQLLLGGGTDKDGTYIIDGNKLGVLPSDLLKHSPCLRIFDVSENKLKSLPSGIFAKQSLLQTVDLRNNQLRQLPPEIFAGLSNLQYLHLNNNQLSQLPSEVFAGLSNLQSLNLKGNQLSELPPKVFAGLGMLQILSLSSNQLSKLPPGVFAGLRSLRDLYLLDNIQLSELPAVCDHGSVNCRWGDMSYYGYSEG
ncbi:unnamed protein product [Durusdinium trenchii]|uniref:Uncharacterized protein n=1 Tax=Durusdinium trenchii TaxID=1381693 RepID=A0ABP0S4I5_9DINO